MVLGMRLGGMEENKKSGGRDVRAKALSWDIEWKKAKNVFFGFFPLSPTVARCARHSHPSPPEEKAASRKKSRLRRKKTAPDAKNGASCVSRGHVPTCGDLPQPTLSKAHCFGYGFLQAALQAAPRLHGVVHDTPSPMASLPLAAI